MLYAYERQPLIKIVTIIAEGRLFFAACVFAGGAALHCSQHSYPSWGLFMNQSPGYLLTLWTVSASQLAALATRARM
jgi:hypothetical protein